MQLPSGLARPVAESVSVPRTLASRSSESSSSLEGWTPVRFSQQERVLELRTGALADAVQSVLTAAGAGQRGLTARETVSELHAVLDPEPLRIRLRQLMFNGGLTVPLICRPTRTGCSVSCGCLRRW